jgi:hypothetical protein
MAKPFQKEITELFPWQINIFSFVCRRELNYLTIQIIKFAKFRHTA